MKLRAVCLVPALALGIAIPPLPAHAQTAGVLGAGQSPAEGAGAGATPDILATQGLQAGFVQQLLMMQYMAAFYAGAASDAVASAPQGARAALRPAPDVGAYFTNGASVTSVPSSGPGASYFTNGAEATSVPSSGPGSAYFTNGAAVTGVPSSGPGAAYFANGAEATNPTYVPPASSSAPPAPFAAASSAPSVGAPASSGAGAEASGASETSGEASEARPSAAAGAGASSAEGAVPISPAMPGAFLESPDAGLRIAQSVTVAGAPPSGPASPTGGGASPGSPPAAPPPASLRGAAAASGASDSEPPPRREPAPFVLRAAPTLVGGALMTWLALALRAARRARTRASAST